MAEFITKCPHCNSELQVQDEWIGMEVECPQCRKIFAINNSFAQTETAEPAVVITPDVAAGEKQCPFCGGVIKEQAVFCRHCKTNLNQTNAPQEQNFIFICPECETVVELPESLKDKQYECSRCCETSIAKETVDRNCPFCGEKIKIKATVCKHCKQKITPITSAVKKENKNVLQKSTLPVNRNVSDCFQKLAPKTMPAKYHSDNLDYKDVDCVKSKKSTASLVLGIINCLTWIIPIAGIPIGIIGLVLGFKKQYKTGIILNVITLTAAVTNSVIGAILGANGRLF